MPKTRFVKDLLALQEGRFASKCKVCGAGLRKTVSDLMAEVLAMQAAVSIETIWMFLREKHGYEGTRQALEGHLRNHEAVLWGKWEKRSWKAK